MIMSSNRDVEGEGFVTEPSGGNPVPEGEGCVGVAPRKSTAEALDELAEAVVEALDRKGVLCGSRSAPSPVAGYLCGLTRGHESGKHQCRISGRVYVWDDGGTAVMLCGDRRS